MILKTKRRIKALGIMNGTSLDAIDFALIDCDQELKSIRFKNHTQKKIPVELKKKLLLAAQNKSSCYDVSLLNFELGRLYSKQISSLKKSWNWDLVGLHGQTIHHEGKTSTLQIGHPAFIKQLTGKPVFYDFRSADVAAGGQGAPFAPFFQLQLVKNLKLKSVAFHNLGGISNLAWFSGKSKRAYDTGPANILLDAWIRKIKKIDYDLNGDSASKGLIDPLLVNKMLEHPYFGKKFPKSTGREEFNLDFIEQWGGLRFKRLSFHDQMATLTELSALSIAYEYRKLKPQPLKTYFYGGGIYNKYLMERIQFHLPHTSLLKTDDLGWPSQGFEASTFAFLGAARYFNKKVHQHQLTGARRQEPLGSIYF